MVNANRLKIVSIRTTNIMVIVGIAQLGMFAALLLWTLLEPPGSCFACFVVTLRITKSNTVQTLHRNATFGKHVRAEGELS
jgi:hypothetical protein